MTKPLRPKISSVTVLVLSILSTSIANSAECTSLFNSNQSAIHSDLHTLDRSSAWLTLTWERILQKVSESQAHVILIGEQHTPEYLQRHLEMLPLIKAQRSDLSVLFVEFPSGQSKQQIDALLAGSNVTVDPNLAKFEPLLKLASQLNLIIVPIDADWTWDTDARKWKNGFQLTDEFLKLPPAEISRLIQENAPRVLSTDGQNERNEFMANLIQKTLQQTKGTAVFVVGTDHLTTFPSTVDRKQLRRVPERLAEKGIYFLLF